MMRPYVTNNIMLASAIVACRPDLAMRVEPINDRRSEFVFDDDGSIASIEESFYNSSLCSSLYEYSQAYFTVRQKAIRVQRLASSGIGHDL